MVEKVWYQHLERSLYTPICHFTPASLKLFQVVENFGLLTLRDPSSHLVVTLPQHISRYPQYMILYCILVYWHVGISLGIKSCRRSPFLELTHWSPIKDIRWKMTLPLGIISLLTPIARCGNGMVVNLKRCKDGMVVNLDRCTDGLEL